MTQVVVTIEDDRIETRGLRQYFGSELVIAVPRAMARDSAAAVRQITQQIAAGDIPPVLDRPFPYGFWLIQFRRAADGSISIAELVPESMTFEDGLSRAVACRRAQEEQCAKAGVTFSPPCIEQLVAVSPELLADNGLVQGVRYPSPEHMSGWWLVDEAFDGSAASMKPIHLGHVAARRPDVLPFLALPFGYRFSVIGHEVDIWYDEVVAKDPIE